MKTILFLCCLMLLTVSNVFSQQRDRGTFEVIPTIGFAASDLYGSEVDQLIYRYGFRTGVLGDYYFNDRWSLRSGLTYFSMGADENFGVELKLDYLNIPINANWHFGSTRKWNLNFGVTPGFLVSADAEGEDVKDIFTSFQLAFSFGIGYKLEITKSFSLLIDYQRYLGITDIANNPEMSSIRNNADSINLGAVFNFK